MAKSDIQTVSKHFKNRVVAYIPGLAIIFKSPATAILMSQMIYWYGSGKRKDGLIYKTIEELYQETGLTRASQDTAIKELVKREYLEVSLKGVPARRHFKIYLEKLVRDLPSLKDSSKLDYPNPPSSYVRTNQSITKITNNTTTEITGKNFFEERRKLINGKSVNPNL